MPAPIDLSDRELEELEDLLAETPEPLRPLDVSMLDGYLCGVLVQPELVDVARWLPPVFDLDGAPLPDGADAAWRQRIETLAERRLRALKVALLEDGWFDPLVGELAEDDLANAEPELRELGAVSLSLTPWVAGFEYANVCFPALLEVDDDEIDSDLARIFRHLPPETEDQRLEKEALDASTPLATLDDAIEDLVLAVADLFDRTEPDRYRVETVRREVPKVGRNDPCPCGSGKKFKQCHGAG